MKNKKISTWIAILCVFCAILSSGIYSAVKDGKNKEKDVSVVSEIEPYETPAILKVPEPLAVPSPAKSPTKTKIETPEETKEATPVSTSKVFSLPTSGTESMPFSDEKLVYFPQLSEWRCHLGIDFVPNDSDVVLAVADGKIEKIYEDHLFGTTVCIDHGDGLKSFYASLSEVTATEGQEIKQGAEIGKMGQTAQIEEGIHLHFFMEKDGKAINPFGNKQ
ncbi:MAG: peptidoglycan DD-metalloendopeptidase family protein [Clostridia bacterium]|nr:peptidoglycan DD-metalloendopeptidase family protein [Clostridia bacterium]